MKNTVEIGCSFYHRVSGKVYARESMKNLVRKLFDAYPVHDIKANTDSRNISS